MRFNLVWVLAWMCVSGTSVLAQSESVVTPRDRLLQITDQWLGLPYSGGPLGEGRDGKYDQDPLYRFDRFDCVTFVETALSSALTTDMRSFKRFMNEIRYQESKVDYVSRNHFTEVDWLPNNLKNGILFDVMTDVEKQAKAVLPIALAKIDKKNWYAKKAITELKVSDVSEKRKQKLWSELKVEGRRFPVEVSKLPYIPFSEFTDESGAFSTRILEGLPPVMVLSVVRPGWDLVQLAGTELNVTHQGLLLQIGDQWFVRHATSDSRYRVVQDGLEEFLRARLKNSAVKGIHIVGVHGF